MTIIQLVIVLIVVGVLLWALTLIPLDPKIRQIINAVVIIVVVLWLAVVLLSWAGLSGARIGH